MKAKKPAGAPLVFICYYCSPVAFCDKEQCCAAGGNVGGLSVGGVVSERTEATETASADDGCPLYTVALPLAYICVLSVNRPVGVPAF